MNKKEMLVALDKSYKGQGQISLRELARKLLDESKGFWNAGTIASVEGKINELSNSSSSAKSNNDALKERSLKMLLEEVIRSLPDRMDQENIQAFLLPLN